MAADRGRHHCAVVSAGIFRSCSERTPAPVGSPPAATVCDPDALGVGGFAFKAARPRTTVACLRRAVFLAPTRRGLFHVVLRCPGRTRAGTPTRLRRPRTEPSLRDRPTGRPWTPSGRRRTSALYRVKGADRRGPHPHTTCQQARQVPLTGNSLYSDGTICFDII